MRSSSLALGGIIGPVAFVAGWLILGPTLQHYSPVSDAISELARVGRSTRPGMTAAFVVYGASIITFAFALRIRFSTATFVAAVVNGSATIGVAAASLGSPTSDRIHVTFAAAAYVSLCALMLLGSRHVIGAGRWLSVAAGLTAAFCLVLSVTGPDGVHGLFQRLGLTIGDVWFVTTAVSLRREHTKQA